MKITHKQLVDIGYKYLSSHLRIKIIATEFVTGAREIPDLIGWQWGYSTLIECKTSLADFWKDKKKHGARFGNKMGNKRFYLCPELLALKIIKKGILTENWGLLSVNDDLKTSVIIESTFISDANARDEITMLTSALRRVGATKLTTKLNDYKITLRRGREDNNSGK